MFERTMRMLRSAIIALTFISFGQAHAAEDSSSLSEVRSVSALSDATEPSREAHAEKLTIAANSHNGTDVIEEIIVVGNKKKQRLSPDSILVTRPTIEKPNRFDFQLLPAYDPAEANGHFSAVQQNEQLRTVGIVTLFRLNFGS